MVEAKSLIPASGIILAGVLAVTIPLYEILSLSPFFPFFVVTKITPPAARAP